MEPPIRFASAWRYRECFESLGSMHRTNSKAGSRTSDSYRALLLANQSRSLFERSSFRKANVLPANIPVDKGGLVLLEEFLRVMVENYSEWVQGMGIVPPTVAATDNSTGKYFKQSWGSKRFFSGLGSHDSVVTAPKSIRFATLPERIRESDHRFDYNREAFEFSEHYAKLFHSSNRFVQRIRG